MTREYSEAGLTASWRKPSDRHAWMAVLKSLAVYASVLGLTSTLAVRSPPLAWVLAPLFGLAIYRLTFVVHDCAHGTLFRSANMNRRTGRWFAALAGIDFRQYASLHSHHHRRFGQRDDPQGRHYLPIGAASAVQIRWHLLKPLFGLSVFATLSQVVNLRRPGALLRIAIVQFAVAWILTGGGRQLIVAPLPFVSAITFGLFLSQLRGFAEHVAFPRRRPAGYVRSHRSHWLERFLLYDLNFNYHAEHHRYPGVPACRLPALHAALRQSGAGIAAPAESMLRTVRRRIQLAAVRAS